MSVLDRVSVVSASRGWRWVCTDRGVLVTAFGISFLAAVAASFLLPDDARSVGSQLLTWTVVLIVVTTIGALRLRGADEQALTTWARTFRRERGTSRLRYWSVGQGSVQAFNIVGFASVLGIGAAAAVLPRADSLSTSNPTLLVGLSVGAVAVSWLALHVAYGQHYAQLYFREDGAPPLTFPGGGVPIYDDFSYLAFSIGTTLGVTDVTVSSSAMRRVVRTHMLISFLYNTVVLALALAVVLRE